MSNVGRRGLCTLAGAGPGDPGLLTLGAREALLAADLIVHDREIAPAILAIRKEGAAQVVAEGAGLSREQTADILKAVSAGQQVVRLVHGDPFVTGGCAPLAVALADAGLRFEVIPGITDVIGGPAYAGIPVTHREFVSQLNIGQTVEAVPGTVVISVPDGNARAAADRLLANGESPDAQVAWIESPTLPEQRVLVTQLGALAGQAVAGDFSKPAILIQGDVTTLRKDLAWFEHRPLFARRFAMVRAEGEAGELACTLVGLGADLVDLVVAKREQTREYREFAEVVAYSHQYEWLCFHDPDAVRGFFETFFKIYPDLRDLGGVRIGCADARTKETLESFRLGVDLVFEGEETARWMAALEQEITLEGSRFLVLRGEAASWKLVKALDEKQAIVDEGIAYRLVPDKARAAELRSALATGAEFLCFASAAAAEAFFASGFQVGKGTTVTAGPAVTAVLTRNGVKAAMEIDFARLPSILSAAGRKK